MAQFWTLCKKSFDIYLKMNLSNLKFGRFKVVTFCCLPLIPIDWLLPNHFVLEHFTSWKIIHTKKKEKALTNTTKTASIVMKLHECWVTILLIFFFSLHRTLGRCPLLHCQLWVLPSRPRPVQPHHPGAHLIKLIYSCNSQL